jgi:hypothetical protein
MADSDNQRRIPEGTKDTPPGKNETAKINYTATGYGNDHGSIRFGHIDRHGRVTAGPQLQAKDGRHQVSLDNDGPRKGWTTSTSPGNFQLRCGVDKSIVDAAQDTLTLEAANGNITIVASNGKIRLQGTDIELIAVGDDGSKGNIRMNATETIQQNCKKFLLTSSFFYRISSVGIGEISSCGPLTIYGACINGFTAATFYKDSKVGGQLVQRLNNILTAVNIFRGN